MTSSVSEQTPLSIDVSIILRKKPKGTDTSGVIDRSLVELLLAVRATGSMKAACERVRISPRQAQRMLKRFSDDSGMQLITHHGRHGSGLSEQGARCIELYAEARRYVEKLVRESEILRIPSGFFVHMHPAAFECPTAQDRDYQAS